MRFITLFLTLYSIVYSETLVHEGEIQGAKYLILSPKKHNGKVLLLAHGYRPDDAPLSAQFNTDSAMMTTLSNDGWVIASTSYRRNGWIIDDAFADLNALQAQVAKLHGNVSRTYIMGNSMGGQIAVLAAEGKLKVDGAIGIGTALQDFPKEDFSPLLKYSPKIPVILLINQEINRPMSETYFKKAGKDFTALWKIERLGHCNASDSEKLAAIRGLDEWLDGKDVAREKDATEPIPKHPSTSIISITGSISHLNESWGNLTTSYVSDDLMILNAKLNDTLVIRAGEATQVVTLVQHHSLMPEKSGVAYLSPDGFLVLQINGGNLAKKLGVKNLDKLTISKK
jgi:pimeloyl-ACP methyl ester carboxylesterase